VAGVAGDGAFENAPEQNVDEGRRRRAGLRGGGGAGGGLRRLAGPRRCRLLLPGLLLLRLGLAGPRGRGEAGDLLGAHPVQEVPQQLLRVLLPIATELHRPARDV
jgi:hypothetical protein